MNAHSESRNPYTILLLVVGIVAIVGAVLLGVAGAQEADGFAPDAGTVAALAVWSDFLLLVGVIATVAAVLLAGVRWLLATTTRKAGDGTSNA